MTVWRDARGLVWKNSDLVDGLTFAHSIIVANYQPGTLRGIHWQEGEYAQSKFFTVLSGSVRLVVVDLAIGSHILRDVGAGRRHYIPKEMGAGYLTLAPNTVVHYEMHKPRVISAERGARWNDPFFGIDWGIEHPFMNERDRSFPDYRPEN